MGWIITLGILILLAILPLGAALRYNSEGLSLKVIAGPIRIPILPARKKDPEEEQKKKGSRRRTEEKREETGSKKAAD